MIYTTKRFSVGAAATGFGAGAGAILGDKIERGIKKVSHDLKYDNNKFLAQLEKEKEEMKELIRDLENLKRKNPKAYQEGLEWGDAHDDLEYMKELVRSIEKDIKKVKTNPGYGKELSRRMNVSTSGLGMALGGTIGGFGGGLLAGKMTKKFSSKTKEEDFRKELNDAYKKNNRGRNIGHAVLGGSLGMIAGALKKGGNPKSMLIGTAIGSGLGSLSEYGYRKATKQDKEYKKRLIKEFQIITKNLRMSQINQTGRTTKMKRNIYKP